MRKSNYSFKYVCVVCCLKIRFCCLTFPAMSIRIHVISQQVMHFGLALALPDIDLWSIDLWDTDISGKYFVCLQNVLNMSWRHVFKTSSRHVFQTFSKHVFKTSWRRLQHNNFSSSKKSSRRLGRRKIVTLKTFWRGLQYQQMFLCLFVCLFVFIRTKTHLQRTYQWNEPG